VSPDRPPVVVMRLFAAAREAAGTGRVEVEGSTVDEVLDVACRRYGTRFRDVLSTSRVWVNGVPAAGVDQVVAGDEVAVLPPVSGGCR
jgi:sulfur-carrier protein